MCFLSTVPSRPSFACCKAGLDMPTLKSFRQQEKEKVLSKPFEQTQGNSDSKHLRAVSWVSEEGEPFHIKFRNAPLIARASKRKKINPVTLDHVLTPHCWGNRCISWMEGKGSRKDQQFQGGVRSPSAGRGFLASDDRFQMKVVWTRYFLCKSFQPKSRSTFDWESQLVGGSSLWPHKPFPMRCLLWT